MIPLSDLIQGLLDIWEYLVGAVAIGVLIAIAIPVKKKPKTDIQTIIKEEVQNDVKIVTKIHKKEVAIDYDVFLKMLSDYEKVKQDAQKSILTQLALLEAKKEEERNKILRDSVKPENAYKDLVKVKRVNNNGKKKVQDENDEDNDEELIDTSELYKQ
jgi:hypothetical protein